MCGVKQKKIIKAKPHILPFVGPLFGLAGSSLSAGLNGRAEPFSEAGGDIFWDSAGDNKCLFRLGLGGASKCRSFSK